MTEEQGTGSSDRGAAVARSRLISSIAARLGSPREATWIVEHAAAEQAARAGRGSAISGRPTDRVRPPDRQWLERAAHRLAERRAAGEPLQYVLGRWPFRSLDLKVDPRALIPRPETEQVVEVALGELARLGAEPERPSRADGRGGAPAAYPVCADLGTGSGAIALSLAVEGGAVCPGLEVWATDCSGDALQLAHENLRALGETDPVAAGTVRLVEGSWFDPLPSELAGHVDLVVSNPPYVSESEYSHLDPTVREWEPSVALVSTRGAGGVDGMADIEAVVTAAPRWLCRSGALVIEIAPGQAQGAMDVARGTGFGHVATERDLAGRSRILVARW
jgi:release factor glutamine methyltransferase